MTNKTLYIPTVSFPRETQNSLGDHEVLLSFNLDSDAEWFEGWWKDEGEQKYAEYLQRVKDDAENFDD